MTQNGIKSLTFRFVAQHLKHCATAVPNENQHVDDIPWILLRITSYIGNNYVR